MKFDTWALGLGSLAVIGAVIGIALMLSAFAFPAKFQLDGASAVQITQVYVEAQYQMTGAVAVFLVSALCLLGSLALLQAARQS